MGRVAGKVCMVTDAAITLRHAEGTPLSRRGQPMNVVNVVVFLVSDESRMMNGADRMLDQTVTIQEGFMP